MFEGDVVNLAVNLIQPQLSRGKLRSCIKTQSEELLHQYQSSTSG